MSLIEIRKVTDRKSLDAFINFHYDLYQGNQYDAPNLYSDELHTLSKDKNAAFDFCEAEYFLAYKDNQLVGRVAGIINNRANEQWNRKSVRFGWIDFIDDMEVSKALLDAVSDWGRQKGMTELSIIILTILSIWNRWVTGKRIMTMWNISSSYRKRAYLTNING